MRTGQSEGRGRRARLLAAATCVLALPPAARAQVPATLNGPPVQMQPYVPEPGVPIVNVNPGTLNPFGGIQDGNGGAGDGGGGAGGGGGISGSSDALNTMLGTAWGAQASANAQSVGVNPSALAATCVLESACGSNMGGGGGAQGVFQMYPAAFQEGLNTALAANPALASQIVQGSAGMNDPVTQAIAASGYLLQANQALQNAGISNPTVLQARGYYNFGPPAGVSLAQALPSDPMSNYMSAGVMKANGVSPGETVGQWQSSVSSKIGGAAGQTVLT